jgi:Uma2 family endonuclease
MARHPRRADPVGRNDMSAILHLDEESEEEFYPSSDGEPMGETDIHVNQMLYALAGLSHWFQDRPDAYVAADNFFYYREGDRSAVVSPDVYVVFGVAKRLRTSYRLWREGGATPAVVIEITSGSTRTTDTGSKYTLYEQVLQVSEYFLFDPTGDYLRPRLQGYRLVEGRYTAILPEAQPLPDATIERRPEYRLHSEQLGLDLSYEGHELRLWIAATGEPVLSYLELAEQAEDWKEQVEGLRGQTEELREQTEELQAQAAAERHRAEAEAQRAEIERQRAEAEAEARAAVEAELVRLRAELAALREQGNPEQNS